MRILSAMLAVLSTSLIGCGGRSANPAPAPQPVTVATTPSASMGRDAFSGRWTGRYGQPHGSHLPVRFTLIAQATPTGFEGYISEPNTFGDGSVERLSATVVGGMMPNGLVHFSKTYNGEGGVSHLVEYYGLIDGAQIAGSWIIPQGGSGPFVMNREP